MLKAEELWIQHNHYTLTIGQYYFMHDLPGCRSSAVVGILFSVGILADITADEPSNTERACGAGLGSAGVIITTSDVCRLSECQNIAL